jgi:kanamycin kinase
VDLGELGIADRWADLAVATWSTEWTSAHNQHDRG